MATPAAEVDAAGRPVRVSSPDRVIYEATETTPEVTKLMVAEYYVSVGEGIVLSTGYGDKADAFYQKRVPKGAPEYVETATVTFPSGRTADEVCPTEIAVAAWAAQMGTLTFHPWPVRRDRPDHPDELRIDLDPYGDT